MEEFTKAITELIMVQKTEMEVQRELIKQIREDQQRSGERILNLISKNSMSADNVNLFTHSSLETFNYVPDEDRTFEAYFRRYEDMFRSECENWSQQKKVRLLLSKLGPVEHNKYCDFILPRKSSELSFDETVRLLLELFSPRLSLFHKRWKCLNLQKNDEDDFLTYATYINKNCDDFKLSDLTADKFKCLIFAKGLTSAKSAEIRRRTLSKLENEPNLTLQQLAEDCQRYINLKKDSKNIEESAIAQIHKCKVRQPKNKRQNKPSTKNCWRCGNNHDSDSCWYRKEKCRKCYKVGHKGTRCTYVKKTAKINKTSSSDGGRSFEPQVRIGKT